MVKNVILFLFFLSTACALSQAQYVSRLGRFKVDQVKGCAPFTVTILDTNLITTGECTAGKPCLMTAGNNTPAQQNQFTITYPQAGTFTLTVLYQSIGADDITITVDPNIAPEFEVYTCAGLKTSIKITDKNYDQYFIDFNNDGTNEAAIPNSNNQVATYTYGSAGNYNISVKGRDLNSADNCQAKILPFSAIATLPVPQLITLAALDATRVKADFNPQTNIQYKLEIAVNNASTFQLVQTLYGVNTTTIPNLKVEDNFYCFRLGSFDPCANVNTYSFPVCSQKTGLTIQNGVNQFQWTTANAGVNNFEVKRNGASYTTLPGTAGSLSDPDVTCKTNYCYQVVGLYSGGTRSISLEKCGEAFTKVNPAAIENASTQVTNEGVALEWMQDPKFKAVTYTILRSLNNTAFGEFDKSTQATYVDNSYQTEIKTCYRIYYNDPCDNLSTQGIIICPMRLTYAVDNKNAVTLNWSKLTGYKNGVKSYRIQKFDRSGGLIDTYNAGTDTVFVDDQKDPLNQVVQYRVLADANEAGLKTSISNQVVVTKNANLFYPNAFTPDDIGPKANETFTVYGQYIQKMELKIFDRWGTLVYFSDNNTPWDGTNNGRDMPEGTYVWIASLTDFAGQQFSREGTVVILRKKKK
jgi:gliding motility-associated-like protein